MTPMPWNDIEDPSLAEQMSRDGAVLIRRLVTDDEVRYLRGEVARYNQHIVPTLPSRMVRYEVDGQSLRSVYFMDRFDPVFAELGQRPVFRCLVKQIMGWEPVLEYVETFNKVSEHGSEITKHQEMAFNAITPGDMVHIWIALDAATEANGAIHYWLGSHRHGLLPHRPGVLHATQLTVEDAVADALGCEIGLALLPVGGAAIHSGLILHGSPANRSPDPRLGLVLAYRAAHTRLLSPAEFLASAVGSMEQNR